MHIVQVGMEYDVLKENNKIANSNYRLLKENGIKTIELMGSIGSGKTALVIKLAERARQKGLRACAIAGDVAGDDDQRRMKESGLDAINCNTGHECHLDANLVRKSLEKIDLDKYDVIFIENVGNLVCPAEFDTGAIKNAMILSVPEGDDKPLKYPLMFSVCDVLLVNKIDAMPVFDFDIGLCEERAKKLNPDIKAIPISAKTGEGIAEWAGWLRGEVESFRAGNA